MKVKASKHLLGAKWHYYTDATHAGKDHKGKSLNTSAFERCKTLSEVDFLHDYLTFSRNASGKEVYKFVVESEYPLEVKVSALSSSGLLEDEGGELLKDALRELSAGKFVDTAVAAVESKDYSKLGDVISLDIIEFPEDLSKYETVQDTKGYKFLMEIVDKTVAATSEKYNREFMAALNQGKPDAVLNEIAERAQANTSLLLEQLKLCTNQLLTNKINKLIENTSTLDGDSFKKTEKIEALKAERNKLENKVKDLKAGIEALKSAELKRKNAISAEFSEGFIPQVEAGSARTAEYATAKKKNGEVTAEYEEVSAWDAAAKKVFEETDKEARETIFSAISIGVEISAEDKEKFISEGVLPASLAEHLPKNLDEVKDKALQEFLEKVNKKLEKGKPEAEPGE